MSYANQDMRRSKAVSAVAVVVLEAGVICGIIAGLTITLKPKEAPVRTPTEFWPLEKPKPEKDKPVQTPIKTDQTKTTQPPIKDDSVNDNGPTTEVREAEDGETITETSQPPLPPQPKPTPLFTPKGAVPRSAPATWATTSDYPTRDLREGNQGRVGYSLSISSEGKVQSCMVTSSSGSAGLDQATCNLVSRRAKFNPATDENGARVAGSYSGAIR